MTTGRINQVATQRSTIKVVSPRLRPVRHRATPPPPAKRSSRQRRTRQLHCAYLDNLVERAQVLRRHELNLCHRRRKANLLVSAPLDTPLGGGQHTGPSSYVIALDTTDTKGPRHNQRHTDGLLCRTPREQCRNRAATALPSRSPPRRENDEQPRRIRIRAVTTPLAWAQLLHVQQQRQNETFRSWPTKYAPTSTCPVNTG